MRAFVDGLGAEGGTNLAGALEAALDGRADDERLAQIVLVTDGMPSVGEQSPQRIAGDAAGRMGRARIFPVGVGQDVNTYLLDHLAAEGRGSVEYVPPGASVESAVGLLLGKLRPPALLDLRIAESPVELISTQPARLPDLFFGEELAAFPRSVSGNAFIPRLWASRRIGELTRTIRVEGATAVLVEEIRDLGLRFGIITEYTSYLVQEPERLVDAPVPMPRPEAARAQTGAAAFDRAQRSAKLSVSKTLQGADEVAAEGIAGMGGTAGGAPPRQVGGRVFVLRGTTWTDIGSADRIPVTVVAAFSPAYFALVRSLPDLAPYLSAGEDLVVAGRRGSIRIAPHGIETWGPGQLAALVQEFRGT